MKTYAKKKFKLMRFTENRSVKAAKKLHEQRIRDVLDIYKRHHRRFIERDCLFCGSSFSFHADKFHGTYGVDRCRRCSSLYVNPVPDLKALEDYYNNAASNKMYNDICKKRGNKKKDFVIDHRVEKAAEHIRPKKDKKSISILEVGFGYGSFLSKLKSYMESKQGSGLIRYSGIDINKNAAAGLSDEGIEFMHGSVEEFAASKPGSYDIIVHFELIEHLIDPYDFMQKIMSMLKDKGIMIFTTQNIHGLEQAASSFNSRRFLAHGIFPSLHLNAFSITNITHFAIRSGFNILEIDTPGKLDVDILTLTKRYLTEPAFRKLSAFDDDTKGFIQYLISRLLASGHMQCVLQKPPKKQY
jgi:2-polyprenyl-3-methyl-5-hydroxy-6-metoxy-1,4-benzoquinol methylase